MYISEERKKYLSSIKKENFVVSIFRFLILFVFIIGWEIFAKLEFINTFTFSSPSLIIRTFIDLLKTGSLFSHIGITLYEVIMCFFLATIIGLFVSTLLWFNPIISKIVDPYLTVLNSLPKVALGPLIIIWVGASINSIIFMSLLISTFITIINIYNGFISTNKNYIILLRSFGASKWQIFKYAVFPSNLQVIINALKINISMNLIGVIMGELLVSKKGIGYLIMYGSQVFNINLVITGVVILGIISYLMYYIIDMIEKNFNKNK